jgi:tetracycline 7-halogenase / FADH2 O2-dependent halogenase
MTIVSTHSSGAGLQPREHVDADIAIVGSGFSGSLTALCLRRTGRRVVLIERGHHPRFAIGESSTPLANLLLEELADRYGLSRIRPFSKWGTWQRERPDVAAGLKRGFTFFFHRFENPFADEPDRPNELLVAASPHDEIGDTHWYRPAFDHALVREAEAAGTIYLDETTLDRVSEDASSISLEGVRRGRSLQINARFLIDASGPRGFLHRTLGLEEVVPHWLPHTHGVYSHFQNVERWDRLRPASEPPPYARDDAAVHHVFPGGWIWVLRFNNGITSAGAALIDDRAVEFRAADGAPSWVRLLERLPSVHEQFRASNATMPFIYSARLAFRCRQVCGTRWALLPSAAGVIDPLLSTGFPLTLLGIGRIVDLLERTTEGPQRQAALAAYAQVTQDELDATERLVAALYATMTDPLLFKRLALLYFAAASYSEAARRLERPDLAPGFLLHNHPRFGPELRLCAECVIAGPDAVARDTVIARIDRVVAPFDVAGLLDRSRRDWFPVLAEDLLANRSKLYATADEIHRLLERSGFKAESRTPFPRGARADASEP